MAGRPKIYEEPRARLTIEMPLEVVRVVDEDARARGLSRQRVLELIARQYYNLPAMSNMSDQIKEEAEERDG